MAKAQLRITEIFLSLQGEGPSVGWPTTFIRLTGCPLRCHYCDTSYAFSGGSLHSLDEIIAATAGHGARYVCVTGGEPLAQPRCLDLLARLCDQGYRVSLETSGAIDLDGVDARVVKVMDLKTPGSGEVERNLWRNLDLLNPHDQIKLVLRDRRDYEWARFMLDQHRLPERVEAVLFSPCQGELDPARLAQWMLDDRLPVRFQLQLHKVLWGDQPGR